MRLLVCFLLLLSTVGCQTGAISNQDPDAAYFLISRGTVGGPFRWLSGSLDYCKVTQYGLGGSEFMVDIKYDGATCTVGGTSANRTE